MTPKLPMYVGSSYHILYGNPKNWFRRRKQSFETKTFIDTIREVVINDWNLKTKDEKNAIFSKLLHINSAIEFWELKIKKRKNKYNINLNENPITMPNMDTIELVKYADSYIGFKSNNIIFAKMQIKFNNGILESPKNNKYDFEFFMCLYNNYLNCFIELAYLKSSLHGDI